MTSKHSRLKLFGTDGRLGRAVYFLFSFIIPAGVFWILTALTGQLSKHGLVNNKTTYILILVALAIAIYMLIRLTIQRSHDLDKSGWLSILVLLFPPVIIFFWLLPGTKGINSYGLPVEPLPTSMKLLAPLAFLALLLPSIYLIHRYMDMPEVMMWLQQLV